MMSIDTKRAKKELVVTIIEVLEQMVFMFADPVDKPEYPCNGKGICLHSSIEFSGVRNGSIGLIIPTILASDMALNILGMEGDIIAEEMIIDATQELANVVCGRFLTLFFGDKVVFRLNSPSTTILKKDAMDTLESRSIIIGLTIEESSMLGYVMFKD